MTTTEKADALRRLHAGPAPLLLANAWDVASARLLEEAGFPAVATSSAAIANALGYSDGQRISRSEMLDVVRRIARAVRVPVTADMEAGYGDDIASTARALIEAGAVGLNLEDSRDDQASLVDLDLQVARMTAVREVGAAAGVPLVLNARTDAFFLHGAPPFDPFEEAVRRARAYRAAGADCIFTPGLRDLAVIERLLQATPGPLNILAGPAAPEVAALQAVGVRRVSLGSGPYRAALGLLRRIADDLRHAGAYALVAEYAVPPAQVNGWLALGH